MAKRISLQSAETFQSAFQVKPEVSEEIGLESGLGIYGWKTPPMEGFELPETDELIVALHLGGSRRVRAVTDQGLSRTCSAPGMLTILPPGRAAAFRTEGSVSLVSLHIPRAIVSDVQVERLTKLAEPWIPRFAFRDEFVSAGMEALLRAAQRGQPANQDYVFKVADALLCHLAQWAVVADVVPANLATSQYALGRMPLQELLAYVDARLGSKLSIDELADVAGLSRASFTRSFKSAVGLSLHQYLNVRRVTTAKRMLRESDLSLSFIAHEAGFSSQSHFTAIFRSLAGDTPARFRSSA